MHKRLVSSVDGNRGTSGRASTRKEGLVKEVMRLSGAVTPLVGIRNNATQNLSEPCACIVHSTIAPARMSLLYGDIHGSQF